MYSGTVEQRQVKVNEEPSLCVALNRLLMMIMIIMKTPEIGSV